MFWVSGAGLAVFGPGFGCVRGVFRWLVVCL